MRILIFLLFPLLSTAQQFSSLETTRYHKQAANVTIIRDQWGVPHIYGKTDADAVFGLMYAQAEDNFDLVELNFLEMLGRLSEVYGESRIYQDLQTRLIYDTASAQKDYVNSPVWLKKLLDAAADGLNYYLHKNPGIKPRLITRFQPWYALLRTDGSIGATQTGGLTTKDMREFYPVKNLGSSFIPVEHSGYLEQHTGSNGFAVAPSKTSSGNAILYINPHTSFFFRPEVHIVSEEGLNAYGAVTWGTFFIYQGFNEYCGWMHTSSYADVADLYEEKILRKGDDIFQEYDGKLLPVGKRLLPVRIKTPGGMSVEIFETFTTSHGPVVGSRNGKWLSLKENNRSMQSLMQSWLRTKAKGFEDYRKIMEMRVNNSNNTVFADHKGNIAYWHGNFIPRRKSGFDYSLPVDGSTSASDWLGVHEVNETVHVYNPATGWIQNCNSTPFTVSGSSSPEQEDYPEYMAPDGENFRGIQAARLLGRMNQITLESMIDSIGYNRYLSAFEHLQPFLLRSYESLIAGDSLRSARMDEAIALVREWDRVPRKESVAAALAIEWGYRMLRQAASPANPYDQTNALRHMKSALERTTAQNAIQLFKETLDDMEARFGNWKTGWGMINRFQRSLEGKFDDDRESLAVSQAAAVFGSLPSFTSTRFSHTNRRYGTHGNSFVASVEFGKEVKALSVLTGGQSFDPASKNYSDQSEMFLEGKFKKVLFYKKDVVKHAVKVYHPGER